MVKDGARSGNVILLNLLNHLNDIISFKNEQINELVKSTLLFYISHYRQ